MGGVLTGTNSTMWCKFRGEIPINFGHTVLAYSVKLFCRFYYTFLLLLHKQYHSSSSTETR